MNFRTLAVVVAGLSLLLSGCTVLEPVSPSMPPSAPDVDLLESSGSSASPEVIVVEPIEVTETPVEMVRGLDGEPKPVASAATITADPAVIDSLECEPVRADVLEGMRGMFGTPTRSVQVEVGQGVWPAQTWWVVVLDLPADVNGEWGLRSFLTNGPQVPEGEGQYGAKWIPLDDNWSRVSWDAERLAVGKAALAKALGCMDS